MDCARSDTGKTRFPRSVFKGHPRLSKKVFVCSGANAVIALNRNRPFLGTFCKTSWAVQSLVTLHRPLPVISSFFPSLPFRSRSRTRFPSFAAVMAAIIPAGPPPITMPSYFIFLYLLLVDIILIPDMLQVFEGAAQFLLPFRGNRNDQRVHDT